MTKRKSRASAGKSKTDPVDLTLPANSLDEPAPATQPTPPVPDTEEFTPDEVLEKSLEPSGKPASSKGKEKAGSQGVNTPEPVKISGLPQTWQHTGDFLSDFAVDKRLSNAAMQDTTVEVESSVHSRNRALDGHWKTSVYLLAAHGRLPALSGSYRRVVEVAGDMSINLLVLRADGPEWHVPQQWSLVDVSSSVHHLVERFPPPTVPTGFTRFNLFCGKVLLLQNSAVLDLSNASLVRFTGLRHTGFGMKGYRADASEEEILRSCIKRDKPFTEAQLVAKALATASSEKRPLELQLYGPPTAWANAESGTPQIVVDWAKSLMHAPSLLPLLEEMAPKEYLKRLITEMAYQATGEQREGMLAMREEVLNLSDDEAHQTLKELQALDMVNRNDEEVNTPKSKTVAAFPKTSEVLPTYYVTDPTVDVGTGRPRLDFEFEGKSHSAYFRPHRRLVPGAGELMQFSVWRSSAVLEEALGLLQPYFSIDEVTALLVEFNAEMESFVPSVSTTKEKREYGFGRRGIYHCEITTYRLSYKGLWLFMSDEMCSLDAGTASVVRTLVRQVNNQLIAEAVHSGLQPAEICISRCPGGKSLKSVHEGHYLDGMDIVAGRPASYWPPPSDDSYMFFGLSGIQRLIPEGVLVLLQRPKHRVRISAIESYLEGRSGLFITLFDEKDDAVGVAREYMIGMNLAATVHARASDWWDAILSEGFPPDSVVPPDIDKGKGAEKSGSRNSAQPQAPKPSRPKGPASAQPPGNFPGTGPSNSTPLHERPPGPVVTGREIATRSLSEPEFELGNWYCKEVARLKPAEIRYMASRCRDLGDSNSNLTVEKEPGLRKIIHPKWAETILRYTRLPDLSKPPGTGKNWFMPYDASVPVPEVFRKSVDKVVADAVRPTPHGPIERIMKNAAGALPAWTRSSNLFSGYVADA